MPPRGIPPAARADPEPPGSRPVPVRFPCARDERGAGTGGNAAWRAPAGRFVPGASYREPAVRRRSAGIPIPRPRSPHHDGPNGAGPPPGRVPGRAGAGENPRVPCGGRRIRSGGVVPGTRGSRPVRRRPDSPIMTAGAARARNGAGVGSSPGAGSAAKENPGFRAPAGGSSWASRSGNSRFAAGSPASRFPDHDGPIRPGAPPAGAPPVPSGLPGGTASGRGGDGAGSSPGPGRNRRKRRVARAGRAVRSGRAVPGRPGSR